MYGDLLFWLGFVGLLSGIGVGIALLEEEGDPFLRNVMLAICIACAMFIYLAQLGENTAWTPVLIGISFFIGGIAALLIALAGHGNLRAAFVAGGMAGVLLQEMIKMLPPGSFWLYRYARHPHGYRCACNDSRGYRRLLFASELGQGWREMGLIIAALVAFGGFLALFHAFVLVTLFTCVRADPNMSLISPEMDVLVIFICLASAWVLGYLKKDAFSFRSMGTKFYGHKHVDNGYIATKWLTAGFPLLPIRSYIIVYTIKDVYNIEFDLQKNAMQPFKGYFYFPQVLRTALVSYGTIFWCLGCLWLMFFAMCID